MSRKQTSPILHWWHKLSPYPGGRWLVSRLVGFMAPYTGTIGGRILHLEPGFSRVAIKERRKIRNHLNSVHAIALMNLGELASGLAMVSRFDRQTRGIITGLSITYAKKARGVLIAECDGRALNLAEHGDYELESLIRDSSGDVVARCKACWRIGPSKK